MSAERTGCGCALLIGILASAFLSWVLVVYTIKPAQDKRQQEQEERDQVQREIRDALKERK